MQPLYKIAADYLWACDEICSLPDMPPEVINDTIKSLSGEVEFKAINVAAYIKNLEADAARIGEAEESMKNRRLKLELKSKNLRNYLLFYLNQCGFSKINSSEMFQIKIKNNPPSVVVENESEIPNEFKNIQIIEKIDKLAIKKAIKNGINVPGAHIEQSKSITIK